MMIKIVEFMKKWVTFSQNASHAAGVRHGGRLMLWTLFWTIAYSYLINSEQVLLAIVISQTLTYLFFVLNALLVSSDS